ncbi:MAG: ABC transporter ATP-binding protein/permease [Clostridia bacterium]|nr:ABC transporter ATP-binding protein/permease [Clostridia bacterium]
MLELVDIKKKYELKDQTVDALKGVSIRFRDSEFVSILGPSGCGKTTLLNIIGGLDKYSSGDIIIDGKSTTKYKDKDWDNYRNHRIGFVFQSYNLIPQLTVLENVELALRLSGIKRKERRKRAIEVLHKVGLEDKLKSKPNQLSGGQMQRVAIARALVNDPEIILADEPTGALDSKTSVQIMELLKEVSNDRLVIMVTHNPELANTYSTRIINLLDGELLSDSKPYKSKKKIVVETEKPKSEKFKKTKKKKSMSFFSALSLSFKNLLTKKGRTILVSLAGSIGIIGIALITAVSSGFSGYINRIQEETLSSYPITIQSKSVDVSTMMGMLFTDDSKDAGHDDDAVYTKESMTEIFETLSKGIKKNNLNKFYEHINENYDDIKDDVSAIKYTYDMNLGIYHNDNEVQPESDAISKMMQKYSVYLFAERTNLDAVKTTDGFKLSRKEGETPKFDEWYNKNILSGEELSSAPIDKQAISSFFSKVKNTFDNDNLEAEYDMISADTFITTKVMFDFDSATMSSGMSLMGNSDLVYEMIDNEKMINEQYKILDGRMPEKADEAILVLDKNSEVDEYALYTMGLLPEEEIDKILKALAKGEEYKSKVSYSNIIDKEYKVLVDPDYAYENSKGEITLDKSDDKDLYKDNIEDKLSTCTNKLKIVGIVRLKDNVTNGSLSTGIAYTKHFTEQMLTYYNSTDVVKDGYLNNLSLDSPKSISIYATSFEAKDRIEDFIDKYNKSVDTEDEIGYTDLVGIIMSSVSTIINSITYVLIAFVSVSLIVSSIMIGIITYISVIERTKEIGVLRSVGASKRDVSRVFNAETTIIGFSAGLLGVAVAGFFTLLINILLKKLTGIAGLAVLSPIVSILLITISVVLTLIAGIIPARIAAKKDPVLALRSE